MMMHDDYPAPFRGLVTTSIARVRGFRCRAMVSSLRVSLNCYWTSITVVRSIKSSKKAVTVSGVNNG